MVVFLRRIICILTCAASISEALRTTLSGPNRPIGQLERLKRPKVHTSKTPLYPEHFISVPIDHFQNESRYEPHTNDTFPLRYWFDASYYKPGGPVYILQGGETSGADRLPFLQKGLLHQLAKATNGVGVVLEHRYYGTSYPTPTFSTKNLRFLTTEQAMADEAYFAQNIKFPGLEQYGDLTSHNVPYIGYGGSYAGAFNAFLRVQYPEVFWGTISSSGVTRAIFDYWQYFQPIADFAEPKCIATQQTFTHMVDNIVIGKNKGKDVKEVKAFFGLPGVKHLPDFTSVLTAPLWSWQERNWDPEIGTDSFDEYCGNITSTDVLYPSTQSLRNQARRVIEKGGYEPNSTFVNQLLNYVGYLNSTEISPCALANHSQESCFGTYDQPEYGKVSQTQTWRLWPYQYCTEWGYLSTGLGHPTDSLPLRSRTIDIQHEMVICNQAFDIWSPPDMQRINKYGGYNISYPRLAIIDGDRDPWRPATPHAFEFGAHNRTSTTSEPFILIEESIHHFDQNGAFKNETKSGYPPKAVVETQAKELAFVKEWLKEWDVEKGRIKLDL